MALKIYSLINFNTCCFQDFIELSIRGIGKFISLSFLLFCRDLFYLKYQISHMNDGSCLLHVNLQSLYLIPIWIGRHRKFIIRAPRRYTNHKVQIAQ